MNRSCRSVYQVCNLARILLAVHWTQQTLCLPWNKKQTSTESLEFPLSQFCWAHCTLGLKNTEYFLLFYYSLLQSKGNSSCFNIRDSSPFWGTADRWVLCHLYSPWKTLAKLVVRETFPAMCNWLRCHKTRGPREVETCVWLAWMVYKLTNEGLGIILRWVAFWVIYLFCAKNWWFLAYRLAFEWLTLPCIFLAVLRFIL